MMETKTIKIANYQGHELIHKSERTLVYRGRNLESGQSVIIKLMVHEYPNFNELVQFRNQYAITKNLDIPGIVKPYSLLRHKNGYALIMEDIGAISLAEYQRQSSVSFKQFWEIALSIAEILHHLHQNQIIHKDIKPANILIHLETKEVKLIDFSISSLLPKERTSLQTPNVLEGTLAYLSPEQTGRMNRGIDYRSDFYSLGITFYELLTGKLPFESEDPLELVHAHIAKTPPIIPDAQVPKALANIVVKLMAKNAEERYQSALGLKYDLEKCRIEYEETGKIEPFVLGEQDRSDRFLIPEKLYGRETEVQTLLDAFERVASPLTPNPPQPPIPPNPPLKGGRRGEKGGGAEMMLVAGFSGIGKTAVINEVHKPIVRQRGYFIKGKFDQFNRDIPFSAFVIAFRDLMGRLLGESDVELAEWKGKILEAVGENGQVLIDVIPELKRIIGEQPRVPELSGTAAQNRFNLLFQKFICVFTTIEHPLTLFLDDLQWADSASLNLMKVLMGNTQTGYLLLLGAYRDNEVFPAHPLMLSLTELEKQETRISTITLAPLPVGQIERLVAETLSCTVELAAPLTDLVYQKTRGNPFFTTQFLKGLHEDGLIAFNQNLGSWECDLVKVRNAALTDDVVEFVARRLHKLPEATQKVLKLAACIGNQFDLETLAIICETPSQEVAADLWSALREGLILPQSEAYKFFQEWEKDDELADGIGVGYRFLHDRVQQAAYSLIPEEQKQTTHYRIGQLLLDKIPKEGREERIFELVGQLNYGNALISEQAERDELAKLNLIACSKARAATAYQTGREYATAGLSLLGENAWEREYEMSLAFHDNYAELASLCGDFEAMEHFVETIVTKARSLLEQVNARRIRILSNLYQNKLTEAVALGIQLLQQLGVSFSETPTEKDIQEVVAEIDRLIGDREIEDLLNLPSMTDQEKIAIIEIANRLHGAAYISGSSLFPLLIILPVKLSIQYGNISASAYSYAAYGLLACNLLQDINKGVNFGQLGLKLVSKLDAKTVKPEVLNAIATYTVHRKSHVKETLPLFQEGYKFALEVGNLEFVGYTAHQFCLYSFLCAQPLATLEQEARAYYHALLQLSQLTTANYCRIHWQATLNLLGATEEPSVLSGEAAREEELLSQLLSNQDLSGLCFFYSYKLMLCYLFGEIESAQTYAVESRRYLIATTGMVNVPAFYLYDSLTVLAVLDSAYEDTSEALQRVEENQRQLQQQWADYAPMNHQHKVDLVEAEKYRVLGRNYEAGDWYDRAIAGAKTNEYLQEEALANELAAKFYLEWGKEKVASGYMQEAYYCYAGWGAKAKIEDLEKRYPTLLKPIIALQTVGLNPRETIAAKGTISTINTGRIQEMLDLSTLMKASRALSQDISLEGAIANLMQVAMENAGAETVALMLFEEKVLMLTALVTGEESRKIDPIPLNTSNAVPLSIINKVKRTLEPIAIDDASNESAYAGDAYIRSLQPKSILCLPLVDRGRLIGILYLENNQVAGAFTSDRVQILTLLCSQAAISLENAQFYQELQNYAQELKQTQLQLVQSEKMATVGQLTAGVAHEINNPVGFISGNLDCANEYIQNLKELLQLYQQGFAHNSPTIEEKIEEIELDYLLEDLPQLMLSMQEGTNRIIEISKSMRTFSRGDTATKLPFNLHDGIDSTLLILKHRLKANENRPEIEIVKNYGELPEVNCYPGQLNQVFMNLLANAIEALEEGNSGRSFEEIQANPNRISIATYLEADRAVVKIADNGVGMSEAVKQQIFEQGFTTKGVGKGTGLGMAIAKQIIEEKHGGTITCISKLGKGTEFTIALALRVQ